MQTPLRVLLVEDSEADAELLAHELKRAGLDVTWERVQSAARLEMALDRGRWDIVVGDNSMPGFSGTEALALVRSRGLDIPFIFVSGTINASYARPRSDALTVTPRPRCARLRPAMPRWSKKPRWASTGRHRRADLSPPTPHSRACSAMSRPPKCWPSTWHARSMPIRMTDGA